MGKLIDLTGQTFGRLRVLRRAEDATDSRGWPRAQWLCICECGESLIVRGGNLRSGNTRSCGCLQLRIVAEQGRRNTKHGLREHPLYGVWRSMKKRCLDPKNENYKNYGGRGITVCDRWIDSFPNFLADMGERPPDPADWSGEMPYWTIDRIDPNGNYEPDNCRWATPEQQRRNRR